MRKALRFDGAYCRAVQMSLVFDSDDAVAGALAGAAFNC
jgi:hypothetical protein